MTQNKKLKYSQLSKELQEQISEDRAKNKMNPYCTKEEDAIRRDPSHDRANLWRPAFVRDTEKILHLPYYNRYADKTQVFSFYHNDDITRRALHVQLVSRIARNIGQVLGLNLDLIEAIALGHDIGHTPFGHAGERYLSELLQNNTGRHFNHNVQSVRVLDKMFARNLNLQTLDGIVSHNGEFEMKEYIPTRNRDFAVYDSNVERCYVEGSVANNSLVPATLEGCVVRICDMIAYLGKDRQDAQIAKIIDRDYKFKTEKIGAQNAALINNLTVDIIENSYGKPYIMLSDEAYMDLKMAKDENYRMIYKNERLDKEYEEIIKPMFEEIYRELLAQIVRGDRTSIIYKHHIDFIEKQTYYYDGAGNYLDNEPNQIVVDYIASMTDDYFLALYKHLFPNSKRSIEYHSYFEE